MNLNYTCIKIIFERIRINIFYVLHIIYLIFSNWNLKRNFLRLNFFSSIRFMWSKLQKFKGSKVLTVIRKRNIDLYKNYNFSFTDIKKVVTNYLTKLLTVVKQFQRNANIWFSFRVYLIGTIYNNQSVSWELKKSIWTIVKRVD